MRTRTRLGSLTALAMVGAIGLSGCTVHPGSAAVVDGHAISQSHVDDLVLAACAFSKVQRAQTGGTSPGTSMAYLRQVLLQDLISFQISHRLVTLLHLSVSPAKIAEATQGQTIPASLGDSDKALLQQFFDDSAKSQIEQAVIGAHLKDPSVTNADKVTPNDVTAAQKFLTKYTERQHVTINPAYGSWSGAVLVDTDGSLSVPQSSTAKRWLALRKNDAQSVNGLPPSQVCG